MSWFRPLSLEQDHKFELIGLLFGLAVYNGLTLPVNFPLILYRMLMYPTYVAEEIADIEDGWPQLAKGLKAMLAWTDGDVADVFSRDYSFSIDVFGQKVNLAMPRPRVSKPAAKADGKDLSQDSETTDETRTAEVRHTGSAEDGEVSSTTHSPLAGEGTGSNGFHDTPLVTNETRQQYVKHYVTYLTLLSVEPQLQAFRNGFQRCVSSKALTLLDAKMLKSLVEGDEDIDVSGLEKITHYEGGFHRNHPIITAFWKIVHGWAADGAEGRRKVRNLLEFVTAYDRVPIGGVERLTFVIQRNGSGDDRLPTSLTCFGRLLLAEYSSPEAMKLSLERAIQEAKGFGLI